MRWSIDGHSVLDDSKLVFIDEFMAHIENVTNGGELAINITVRLEATLIDALLGQHDDNNVAWRRVFVETYRIVHFYSLGKKCRSSYLYLQAFLSENVDLIAMTSHLGTVAQPRPSDA